MLLGIIVKYNNLSKFEYILNTHKKKCLVFTNTFWDTLVAGTKIVGNGMVKVACEMVGEMIL